MLAPTNIPCRNFELKSVVLWQKLISLNLKFDRKDGKSRISRWMPHKTPNPNRSLRRNRNRRRRSKSTKTKSRFLQKKSVFVMRSKKHFSKKQNFANDKYFDAPKKILFWLETKKTKLQSQQMIFLQLQMKKTNQQINFNNQKVKLFSKNGSAGVQITVKGPMQIHGLTFRVFF